MRFAAIALLASLSVLAGPPTASDISKELEKAALDQDECYRVRDVKLVREDIKLYLNDGYLIFGKPIVGRKLFAIFVADEGGDGELLLFPPVRSERRSLATYAKTPNLDEHLDFAMFVFTDDSAQELYSELARTEARKVPERGMLLAEKWADLAKNLTASFQIRLVGEALANHPLRDGFFFAGISGKRIGNMDVILDPFAPEQITVGQVATRENRTFFDIWASFRARSWRKGLRQTIPPDLDLNDFRIDATLTPDLHLKVVTKVKVTVLRETSRALPFDLSNQMRLSEVKVDGVPVEVFSNTNSLRANLLRGGDNSPFLVVAPTPFEKGRSYEFEFHHEGDVISEAGNNVYFVGSRGAWYPNRGADFARYDLTFRYPKHFDLVATGDIVDDRDEGDMRVTRRKTSTPIRFAGFNLGDYEKAVQTSGPYTVEVYANRRVENALKPKSREVYVIPPARTVTPVPTPRSAVAIADATPDPTRRLQELANEISSALDFMTERFGPPAVKTLTVSPIPGTFGQGFPGLLYLSTLSYLAPNERPAALRNDFAKTFYSELLDVHETAHQWWGNIVTTNGYEDEWLMESLADYSALMYLEKKRGRKAMDGVLDIYKAHLLAKSSKDGDTLESFGPIVWGTRLFSSQAPDAWRTITYEKGAWIIHMLRGRLGDAQFFAMLRELATRYRFKPITTDQFRQLAAEFMPKNVPDPKLEAFFDQWVYGTGIPTLKMSGVSLSRSSSGRVRATITQSEVDEDFSVYVPVEIQLANKRMVTKWIQTSSEPVTAYIEIPRMQATKAMLDPSSWVLAVHK